MMSWSLMLAALCGGLATGLTAWWLAMRVAEVPPEDRAYWDRPPLGFRLCWGLIYLLSHFLAQITPSRVREAVLGRLYQAGLDFVLKPEQLLAAHVAGFLIGALTGVVAALLTGLSALGCLIALSLLGGLYPAIWLRDRIALRRKDLLKTLPFYLDMITLCVEAGLNLSGALRQATLKGPPGVLRDEFQRILRDVRAGRSRIDALRQFARRMGEPSVTAVVSSIVQAENTGMNLGPILRAQADQRRTERFLRAEKLAMEAPVKMLLPLIAFIFPCTFIVLGFPIAMMFMDMK